MASNRADRTCAPLDNEAVCNSVGHRSACSISTAKTLLPNATHERNCKTYSEKHKISSRLFTLHFLKSGVGIAGSHLSALLKMSFSSDLLSARSAAGVSVDVKGTSGGGEKAVHLVRSVLASRQLSWSSWVLRSNLPLSRCRTL